MPTIADNHRGKHYSASKKAQSGAALLVLMLILIVGSSFFLATKLNTNLALTQQDKETGIALSTAKAALIGYAVTYPDNDTDGVINGPGYLPCPDINNDGNAAVDCLNAANSTIGRFPYETLRTGELRDNNGQRLWYALSENFSDDLDESDGDSKTIPLNSETPSSAELSINGVVDIVAVIIAPGAPVNGQNRDPDDNNIATEISNYLEGSNKDLGTSFVTTLGDFKRRNGEYDADENYTFNDRMIIITRQELMAVVEKRVLGEVAQRFRDYQIDPDNDDVSGVDPECGVDPCDNAFPWLSPFATPSTSSFRAGASIWQGHIPYHWSNDLPGASARNPFNTSLKISWNIVAAVLSAGTTISDDTMQNSSFNDPVYGVINPVDITNASCEWTNRNSVKCTGTRNISDPTCSSVSGTCPQVGTVSCDRSYDFDLEFLDESAATVSVTVPDAANVRTRDVTIDISLLTTILTNYSIQITDNYTIKGPNPPCKPVTFSETRSLTVDVGNSTGTMTIAGIHYDLDVDGMDLNADDDYDDTGEFSPEIPEWFIKNNWHHQVFIAYPASELIPGGATACITATDCIELNGSGSPDDNKRAIAIIAGESLSTQDRTIAPTIDDWFENENKNGDDIFEKANSSSTFNDHVRIISTN